MLSENENEREQSRLGGEGLQPRVEWSGWQKHRSRMARQNDSSKNQQMTSETKTKARLIWIEIEIVLDGKGVEVR